MANKKLSDLEVKALLQAEKANALAGLSATTLVADRARALNYYKGDMSSDMPTQDGRSEAVSLDVADTVEGLMPSLMEIFAGGDEVVRFEPVGPEDVGAAAQETDYVNHVFLQQNPGFMILYTAIKDALLEKVGIGKVWSEETEKQTTEKYFDQPDDALAALAADENVEITAHTPHEEHTELGPVTLHDIECVTKKKVVKHIVKNIPPEQFGIARDAQTISEANYCFHEEHKTESELIEDGYDEEQVKSLPTHVLTSWSTGIEAIARDSVNESTFAGSSESNNANRMVKITEHYVVMNYKGDRACRYRVVTGGDQGEVLRRNGAVSIEECEENPFFALTPIPQPHRFIGHSVADTVIEIQKIKTALIRGKLDNIYLHNNPRVEVAEAMASENTIDDLLVSRPGGLVRVRQPGGINWQVVPDISQSIYPALEYWDTVREWRTGVTRAGQGIDADALQNQTATAVNQSFNAAQAKMRLIARIFAETGIRDLFSLLHGTIRKYGDQASTVRLRNQWVQVNPRDWRERNDMTITVGLGDGSKSAKVAGLMQIINYQAQAMAAGKVNLVDDAKIYNSAKELTKLLGYRDPTQFINDPSEKNPDGSPAHPPAQQPPDPKLQVELLKQQTSQQEIQLKAQLEGKKAEVDAQHQLIKTQADIHLAQQKHELDAQLKVLEHQLKQQESEQEMRLREMEMAHKREAHHMDLQQQQVEHGTKMQDHEAQRQYAEVAQRHKETEHAHKLEMTSVKAGANAKDASGAPVATPLSSALSTLAQTVAKQGEAIQHLSKPKRVVRDQHGRVSHVETIE